MQGTSSESSLTAILLFVATHDRFGTAQCCEMVSAICAYVVVGLAYMISVIDVNQQAFLFRNQRYPN